MHRIQYTTATIVALAFLAPACTSPTGTGGGTTPSSTVDSSGGTTDSGSAPDASPADATSPADSASTADAAPTADTNAADTASSADIKTADTNTKPGCGSAKVTLVGKSPISGKTLDFPDVCNVSNGDELKLSLKNGKFTFFWEPLTSEPPRITVDATGMKSGAAKPLGDDPKIVVPMAAPFGNCTTKAANKPADIGTATLTYDSEKPGSKYTFEAQGKASCYSGSSGGTSWPTFTLKIEGTL